MAARPDDDILDALWSRQQGWIGVDLDGTLAYFDHSLGWEIGPPIPSMVERVKKWLAAGRDVRIFTARATMPDQVAKVEEWCLRFLGAKLPVVCSKDFEMDELWDDRCVQIETNTGRRIDGRSE